jgi:superfamily II DNA or RNA helicase
LTFQNPKYLENKRLGYWTGGIPQHLCFCGKGENGGLAVPRGFIRQLIGLCRTYGIDFQISDRRRVLPEVKLGFKGQLRPFQKQAVENVLSRDFGTLSAPTGSGKTIMALWLIAQRKQPTLVVVHTKELLHQWIDRIESFLGIPAHEVGMIGNGKRILGQNITVALVQTLYKCAHEVSPYIGHLVVDECHRTPSRTFTEAVSAFDCKYSLGLSATPWRRDKLSRLIFWHLGDLVHKIEKETLIESGDVLDAEVITRETDFETSFDPSEQYSQMLSELTKDRQRNQLIASDVAREARNGGGICLVLSDRKAHCESLREHLAGQGVLAELLTGDLSNGQRQAVLEQLNKNKVKVLVATGQLIGEGFDCKALSTLFLATPIRFDGRVLQYLGRVLRPAPGKEKAIVYDYIDSRVGVLRASAKRRLSVINGGKHAV